MARDPARPSHGALRPVLLDHAAGFRKEAYVAMDHENAFGTGERGGGETIGASTAKFKFIG